MEEDRKTIFTFENWTDFPYAETSDPEELTQRQFEEERWNAGSE